MNSTDRKATLRKKLSERKPNVDSVKRNDSSKFYNFFLITLWIAVVLIAVAGNWLIFALNDRRDSYIYKVTVDGNRYQCNIIERGNPTYLKDCWQGENIIIYDPVNLTVME